MSLLKQTENQQASTVENTDWETMLDEMSRQLCTTEELSAHFNREEMYARNGVKRIKMFPIWRRYRWKAQQIARLQKALPILKKLPLGVSGFLVDLLKA